MYPNIPYKSFCWVLGTTSFRVAQMNLRIEQQLLLLHNFHEEVTNGSDEGWQWGGNRELQSSFYEYLKQHGALRGEAPRPDKDARQKTSGLPTLGLTNEDRVITCAGDELLSHVERGDFRRDNYFLIANDSYIYLKQLLKTSLEVADGVYVRPYLVLAHLLNKFDYLTFEEFQLLLPLIVDKTSLNIIIESLERKRSGTISVDEIIIQTLLSKANYQEAKKLWMAERVTEDLITTIGLNRKSRVYDKKYFPLYLALRRVFIDGLNSAGEITKLFDAAQEVALKGFWKQRIFGDSSRARVKKIGPHSLSKETPYHRVESEEELKELFFKDLHLFKAKATLSDYFDLNRRYFKLTDTILFEDQEVRFDTIPKAYFAIIGEQLINEMFTRSTLLYDSTSLEKISAIFNITEIDLLNVLSSEFQTELTSLHEVQLKVEDQRYQRLHELLDKRFKKQTMIELLDCFVTRDDSKIAELVTEDATPSTVFEYILALIWYEFSGRKGRVLDYMKLSLEADLMPRTHAQGGGADIVFEYPANPHHPRHDMLIEATLAYGLNARRMEMEPVSRHLGTHIFKTGNQTDYCVFVTPYLDVNVTNDFRSRKLSGYYSSDGSKVALKIIPLEINDVKQLIERSADYAELYKHFDQAHDSNELQPLLWREEIKSLLSIT